MTLEDLEQEWVAQQATHPTHRPSSPMDESSDEEKPCPFYVFTVEISDISDDTEGGHYKEDDSKEDEDDSKEDEDDSKEDDAMDDGISK